MTLQECLAHLRARAEKFSRYYVKALADENKDGQRAAVATREAFDESADTLEAALDELQPSDADAATIGRETIKASPFRWAYNTEEMDQTVIDSAYIALVRSIVSRLGL